MKYLYPNFLHDKKAHRLNQAFYKRLIATVTGSVPIPFFTDKFANGKKIYDDHIFSAKYQDRILLIKQQEPGSGPAMSAFFKDWEGEYEMLVLTVELSQEIKSSLKTLIKKWLVECVAVPEMRQLISDSTPFSKAPISNYIIPAMDISTQTAAKSGALYLKKKQ